MAQDGLIPDGPVKVANVQRVKGRNGAIHLYFRKGDHREGPLSSPDGTPELAAEVAAILARVEKARAAVARPAAGTIGGLLKQYNKSADFLGLARITQIGYQGYIDEMVEDIGDVLLSEVTRSWVIDLRDAWAPRGHNATNKRMQVLRNALADAIEDDADTRIKGDPFHKVKRVKRPHDAPEPHITWTDVEVETAIEAAIARKQPGLARAIALGRYGGFRRGTICAIPLNSRMTGHDDQGKPHSRLHWVTEKRKVLADKREDARLTSVLNRTKNQAMTIAYNADGHTWKERQLHQALERLLDRLAKDGKVRATIKRNAKGEEVIVCPLTFHGLRHARGVELAMAGASDAEIMSQLEHVTDATAKIYRRQAERSRMADAGQDRVDKVVSMREERAAREGAIGT